MEGLVYISTPVSNVTENDVRDILSKARKKNAVLGITGILLFSGSLFVQILEGRPDTLDDMVKSIVSDSRHEDVTVLTREAISERTYEDWTMAYKQLDHPDMEQLCGQIGWDTAIKRLQTIPKQQSMAFIATSIASIIGDIDHV